MKETYWYYADLYDAHPLNDLGRVKSNLKNAWVMLKTLSQAKVTIVYPLPWDLGADSQFVEESNVENALIEWLDFHIEALSIKQEYPSRVALLPKDQLLKRENVSEGSQSLFAYVWESKHPEAFELLESLESYGNLMGRKPIVRGAMASGENMLVQALDSLLLRVTETEPLIEAARADRVIFESTKQELQLKNSEIQSKNSEIQSKNSEIQSKNSEIQSIQADLQKVRKQLEELKAKPVPAVTPDQTPKIKQLEKDLKESREEGELLLTQLHQVQEHLEQYYLELKEYKAEAVKAAHSMLAAREKMAKVI